VAQHLPKRRIHSQENSTTVCPQVFFWFLSCCLRASSCIHSKALRMSVALLCEQFYVPSSTTEELTTSSALLVVDLPQTSEHPMFGIMTSPVGSQLCDHHRLHLSDFQRYESGTANAKSHQSYNISTSRKSSRQLICLKHAGRIDFKSIATTHVCPLTLHGIDLRSIVNAFGANAALETSS